MLLVYNLGAPVLDPVKPFFNRGFNFIFHRVSFVRRDSLLSLRFRGDETPRDRNMSTRACRRNCSRRRWDRQLKIWRAGLGRVKLGCSTNAVTLTVNYLHPLVNGECPWIRPEPVHFPCAGALSEMEKAPVKGYEIGWFLIDMSN